jgi:predicted TIM-barrel fold metal-dependent hydrolase
MSSTYEIIDANTMLGIHPEHRLDMSAQCLIAQMQKHGIGRSLVISTVGAYHAFQSGNLLTIEAFREDSRLIPVATVNPTRYFGDGSDLCSIHDCGFRICKFFPALQGWEITSSVFGRILGRLASVNMPISIETTRPSDLPSIRSLAAQYPFPIILSSISLNLLSEIIALMEERCNVFIQTDDMHVMGGLEFVRGRIGPERIIFGSGAPRHSVASSLAYVIDSELTEADKKLILCDNIRRIVDKV